MKLIEGWKQEASFLKEALTEWIVEDEIETLIEEGEDIIDGIEAMKVNKEPGIPDEILL